ncbi:MAG: DNA polymerase I, partial [Gemmataceae bacterium]|nr:DNA polymerase I [Gemmataceae bacterium]
MADTAPAGSLYLLDAHGLIFQMFHGIGPMSAPDGRPTNAVFGVTRSLISLYDRGADYLIAVLDGKDPTFREKLDGDYKAHRDPPPADLLLQEPMIHQVMDGLRIPFLIAPAGFEADDVMATLAREGAARGLDVFLCSADKDCRQLLSDKVKILNLRKGEQIDAAWLMTEWGVRPEQVVDFQALVGDAVDNVPGVPGVGPKTAAKWLQQYGTLDAIIAHADEVPGGPKTKAALKEAIANGNLAKSKTLVTLDTNVPLAVDWEGWKRRDWDGQRLLELFHEFGFRGFAERVRKTLATSGAKKNADVLETAGLAPDSVRAPSVSEGSSVSPRKPRGKKAAPATVSLFDAINETTPAAEPEPAPRPDGWDYSNYHLVDTKAAFKDFLKKLKAQTRITFDLETTGLDPLQSDPVGLAFCWQEGEAYYVPVRGPAEDKVLDPAEVLAALKPVFEDPAVAKVNQNIKYDLLVLEAHGIRVANVAGDPMIAHYLLHAGARSHNLDEMTRVYFGHENISITELIGKGKKQVTMAQVRTAKARDYAGEDADTAFRLASILEPQLVEQGLRTLYDELEIPLIGVLAELEFTGIRLDVPFLTRLSGEMETQLAAIETDIHERAGGPFNIASPKQLREVLFERLKLPVQKRTDTTGEASTDAESLERLAALGHPLPRKIVEHRQVAKLKGTYVDALPLLVNPETGRLHTSFNQTVAATGRLSSSDPNLQNIPARTDQGKQIRQAFLPRDGWRLVTADYSQVELRLLAEFSRDDALIAAFAEDADIHARVAAQIFKVHEAEVTSAQRRVAKTVNFGVIYGMSGMGLAVRLGIDRKEADRFIDEYFARFPKVLDYQQKLLADARATGYVGTLLGRKRRFDPSAIGERSSYRGRSTAEREAINMEIQGSAADLMKRALLGVSRRLKADRLQAKMLLTVHDELVFEFPPHEQERLAKLVSEEMSTAAQLSVPLKVDVKTGPNWAACEVL